MGMIAGIGSAVGGLAGLFGGGSDVPKGPPPWLMPGMNEAAGKAFSGIEGLGSWGGMAGGMQPNMMQTFQNLYNNPYAAQFMGGANTAGGMGMQGALNAYNLGGTMTGRAQDIFNTAFDPQGALYGRTLQQTQEQARAGQAARGIAMTPYGAGLEGDATRNFNIDWQNNQLQRQALGAQAGGSLAGLGAGLQAGAPGQFMQAAGMPYGAYGQVGRGQNNAIQSLLALAQGGQGIQNLPVQDWLSYVQTGNQAGGVANQAYQNQLAAQKQQFGQQMQFGQMLGGGLYGLGQTPFGQTWGLGGSGWGGGGGGGYGGPIGNIGYGTGVGAYGPIPAGGYPGGSVGYPGAWL